MYTFNNKNQRDHEFEKEREEGWRHKREKGKNMNTVHRYEILKLNLKNEIMKNKK